MAEDGRNCRNGILVKIAVCLSGMIRTGLESSENIKSFIGELWNSCDFFIHTWDIEFQNPLSGEGWDHYHSVYSAGELSSLKLEKFKQIYNPKKFIVEKYWSKFSEIENSFPEIIPGHPRWWFPLFYSWGMSVKYKNTYELENNFKYDYCIKLRPDLIFSQFTKLKDYLHLINNNNFGVNQTWVTNSTKQCDDILFMSTSGIMDKAAGWWEYRIKSGEYKTEILPHTSFHNFLIDHVGVNIEDLNIQYLYNGTGPGQISLYREECSIFSPINEFNKCVECDSILYHGMKKEKITSISDIEYNKLRMHVYNTRSFFPET